jgi:superfamily II DNA helicase RecQ
MVDELKKRGITAEVLDSNANREGRTSDIIARFKKGETEILCATKGESPARVFQCSLLQVASIVLR